MDAVTVPAMTYKAETRALKKTSGKEACSGPMKHGEIAVRHHEERQDLE